MAKDTQQTPLPVLIFSLDEERWVRLDEWLARCTILAVPPGQVRDMLVANLGATKEARRLVLPREGDVPNGN